MRVAKVVGRRWSRALCPWRRNAALAVLLPAIAACSGGSSAPNDTVTFADPPVLLQLDAQNQIAGSSVWNDLPWRDEDSAGGGGPSVFQEAPPWPSVTGTGASMRTTPDVAFHGDPLPGYTVYDSSNGGWYNDGGTSAATPFFAAATALLHQASLAATGQQAVVAYEWIYGIAASSSNDVFWDITLGDNDLFGVGCCAAGPGYDQASGWGSLDIGAASSILIATPAYRVAP